MPKHVITSNIIIGEYFSDNAGSGKLTAYLRYCRENCNKYFQDFRVKFLTFFFFHIVNCFSLVQALRNGLSVSSASHVSTIEKIRAARGMDFPSSLMDNHFHPNFRGDYKEYLLHL